jgi:hypothetical protein
MGLFSKKPKCPHCDFELDKKPTRKKKCPNCSEFIFVWKGDIYTEKQVKDLKMKNKWLRMLERFGATEAMFSQVGKNLSKRFGFEASVNDTIWGVMNTLTGKQEDLIDMVQLYLHMADFVEAEGKDPEPYIKQAMEIKEQSVKLEVLGIKKDIGPIKMKITVNTCNDQYVCEDCEKISREEYEIDDFLKKLPIPNNCSNPRGCRCWVGATFK